MGWSVAKNAISYGHWWAAWRNRGTMRLLAYIVGFLILLGGLAWAALEAGAPQLYVMIGSVILFGIGIMLAATRTTRLRSDTNGVTVVRDTDPL